MSNFYSNFVSLCNNAGKSPSRAVIEIGLQKSSITRWKGGGFPTDATAKKIADYFGVSVDELTGKEKTPTSQTGNRLSKETLEVVNLFEQAEPWVKDQVLSLLRAAESHREAQDVSPKEK